MSLNKRQKSKPKLLQPFNLTSVTNPANWSKISHLNPETNFDKLIKSKTHHKLLPTIEEQQEMNKANSKQLSNSLTKLKHLNTRPEMKLSQQIIRTALNVIKYFSKIQNNFKSAFQVMYDVFKRFCFIISDGEIFNHYGINEGISFRKACFTIEQQYQMKQEQTKIRIQALQRKNQSFQQLINNINTQFQKERKILKQQLEKYKKLANIDYVRSLQKKIVLMKQEISQKIDQQVISTKLIEQAYHQISEMKLKIQQLNNKIVELKNIIYEIELHKVSYDKNMKQIKYKFDGILYKIGGLQEKIVIVQQKNSYLIAQNNKILNGVSVGFQNLTPRPKYNKLFNKNDLNKIPLNSTQDIMQKLLKQSKIEKQKFIRQNVILKTVRNLQQAEKIRQNITNDIIQFQKQML